MFEYHQISGDLLHDGVHISNGYSGSREGKNNPSFQRVRGVGPIPQGRWRVVKPAYDSSDHGPLVMRLEPLPGTDVFGRSGFLIHGDSRSAPGSASHGCIILPRITREFIANSPDDELLVTA